MPAKKLASQRIPANNAEIDGKHSIRKFRPCVLGVLLIAGGLWAQGASGQKPDQDPSQKQADKSVHPTQPQEEVKITPSEAEDLFHSVDEILEFDSKETGLAVKRTVKRRLTSRDEVVKYLTGHMKDQDTRRLERSAQVLKKFGLLPRDFDLEKLLIALLREQVAGYYDSKTKTVNLLDWIPPAEQEPVLAHELTHALQDQAVGLEKFMKKGERDLAESKRGPTAEDIENDEMDNARQAVVEGQAETVMLDYALKPVGRSIADSPEVVAAMVAEMNSGTADSSVFKSAPLFLRESLTFPYNYGLKFEIRLMEVGGREKAFTGVLANPPHSTRQIMQPETYMADEKLEPMRVVDFARDFKNYDRFDVGAMGEFDTSVLIEQYAGKEIRQRLYQEWRGGYYYAARPKGNSDGRLGVLYVSRWSNAEKAGEFASVYARAMGQRYKQAKETSNVVEGGPPVEIAGEHADFKIDVLKGRHEWATEEGAVVIEVRGDTVLVTESLDAATTAVVEKEVFSAVK